MPYRLSKKCKNDVCVVLIILAILFLIATTVSVIVVALTTTSSMDMFDLRPATVLLGDINFYKYGSVKISTEDPLSDNTQIWLADEEALLFNENISEPQVLSNFSGSNVIYAVLDSNFTFDFFNVSGPPGSVYRVQIVEDGNSSNIVCSHDLLAEDNEATFTCVVNQTNYYNIKFTVDSGITGKFREYFTIIGLNLTFYTSSSYPSCSLNHTHIQCTFSMPLSGKNGYLVAFSAHDQMSLSIMYYGQHSWYAIGIAIPVAIFLLGCLITCTIHCVNQHYKRNT